MTILLGVDGGQTSTAALVADATGAILGSGRGGPANHIHEPGGLARMENSLREAVTTASESAGLKAVAATSACFGMTGGMERVPEVAGRFLDADRLSAVHDVVTALAGASAGRPGVIVIAGTGAIAYGRTEDGREAKADGMGYLMGDEGSGYWIGVQGLRAVARAADGRGPATLLSEQIPQALGVDGLSGIHRAVYSQTVTRPQIAGLALVVACAAQAGDDTARSILAEAGARLAETALAVIRGLALERASVYLSGGVFRSGGWVQGAFEQHLRSASPDAVIEAARYPQVVGALIMAYQQLYGQPPPAAFLARMEATLPENIQDKSAAPPCP